jgi:hypothetical protein
MFRRAVLLFVLTMFITAGCSIDRVEWETTGFVVDEVTHILEEEHHVSHPVVECIQREVQGAEWECRAHAGETEYHCHVKASAPHEEVQSVHCESEHEAEEEAGSEGHDEDAPAAEKEQGTSTATPHDEDELTEG